MSLTRSITGRLSRCEYIFLATLILEPSTKNHATNSLQNPLLFGNSILPTRQSSCSASTQPPQGEGLGYADCLQDTPNHVRYVHPRVPQGITDPEPDSSSVWPRLRGGLADLPEAASGSWIQL